MYHRIVAQPYDPWAICVSPTAFDEQMAVLAAASTVRDLADFAGGPGYSRSATQAAVTFDDGYLDNLTVALPILERHNVPATVFVIGNAIGRTREFWWDGLDRALVHDAPLPQMLPFPFGRGPDAFTLHESDAEPPIPAGWRADAGAPVTARQRLFRALWDAIVVLEPTEQDDAVAHVLQWAGQPVDPPTSSTPRGALGVEDLAALAAHPLISIGSHTLDHLSLTDLDPGRQRQQIHDGHRKVEELIGAPVDRFSYPFGRHDATARDVVRSLGVRVACTSEPLPATVDDDPQRLPRLQAVDDDGETFARWLHDDHGLPV